MNTKVLCIKRSLRSLLTFIFIMALVACGTTDPTTDPPIKNPPIENPPIENPPVKNLPAKETYDLIEGIPRITLSDGSQFALEPLDLVNDLLKQFPPTDESSPSDLDSTSLAPQSFSTQALSTQALPSKVNLGPLQTPIKNQGDRGTCVAFTSAAALEAAYKRERGVNLDLSEQYANHVQKMAHLNSEAKAISERETQLGAWGGSGVGYQLNYLFRTRFGLPVESSMSGIDATNPATTYISAFNYEKTSQEGDSPSISVDSNQKTIDEWNLSSTAMNFNIPETRNLVNFPLDVRNQAVYGVKRVRAVERSLDGIRAELAAGREVAFGVSLTRLKSCKDEDDNDLPEGHACYAERTAEQEKQYKDGIWHPLTENWGGHAMLIVGYDDDKKVFIVKNSWGRNAEGKAGPAQADLDADGFIEMSYDWVDKIYEAHSILETRNTASWLNYQDTLGMWKLEADTSMQRAKLAAYHIPGTFPASSLSGQTDRRIGTLYQTDSRMRVNGSITQAYMTAYFGSDSIDQSYNSFRNGTKIKAYRIDAETMAGTIGLASQDVTNHEPFFATLGDYPNMQPARAGDIPRPAPLDYYGKWTLKGNGLDGTLSFNQALSGGGGVFGTYTAQDGTVTENARLYIKPGDLLVDVDTRDPCSVRISIPLSTPKTIYGKLFCNTDSPAKRALITGGPSDGKFYAYRQKLGPKIIITSPSPSTSRAKGTSVYLNARTEGIIGSPTVRWSSNLDGALGEGTIGITRRLQSYGLHTITATVNGPSGELRDTVQMTITNDDPTISITAPIYIPKLGPKEFCKGESIAFKANASDINQVEGLPETAITWQANGNKIGTGRNISKVLALGIYTITATATDENGATDSSTTKVNVIECSNDPPTVNITTPATDSGINDNEYVIDGYDSTRGQWYTQVTLQGNGTDTEDGTLSGSSLVWKTNRSDLQTEILGTGNSISVRLYSNSSGGTNHEVSLTVTDSDGNSRTLIRRINLWDLL